MTATAKTTPSKKCIILIYFWISHMSSVSVSIKGFPRSICYECVQFQIEIQKSAVGVHFLQTTQNLVISRCCFTEDDKEMYQELKCKCTGIVLLIKPFFLVTFVPVAVIRSNCLLVLRKVPTDYVYGHTQSLPIYTWRTKPVSCPICNNWSRLKAIDRFHVTSLLSKIQN